MKKYILFIGNNNAAPSYIKRHFSNRANKLKLISKVFTLEQLFMRLSLRPDYIVAIDVESVNLLSKQIELIESSIIFLTTNIENANTRDYHISMRVQCEFINDLTEQEKKYLEQKSNALYIANTQ